MQVFLPQKKGQNVPKPYIINVGIPVKCVPIISKIVHCNELPLFASIRSSSSRTYLSTLMQKKLSIIWNNGLTQCFLYILAVYLSPQIDTVDISLTNLS